jgi:phenylpropionate dioxygenase-like ring-hydroxylating dioxygenase large terminal subunit
MNTLRKIRDLIDLCKPGYTLPQPFYNDVDVFEFDITAVLARSWLMVGFEAELTASGSYLAMTIGRDPILIVRGRDGIIRAFHNTCRHRGSQICVDGHARATRLVCPYHQWTYDLDGRLLGAPRMPADFMPADHGLRPIPIGPVGPQETHVISKWLVHKDAAEGVDYEVDRLIETWTKTNLQDRALAENNQRGVNGRGYAPGPYSEEAEDFVIRFSDWYRATARSAADHLAIEPRARVP